VTKIGVIVLGLCLGFTATCIYVSIASWDSFLGWFFLGAAIASGAMDSYIAYVFATTPESW
jgi:hypothetical protein